LETDFKTAPRIRDPKLMRQAHWAFDECAICAAIDISIHHILSKSSAWGIGDDVWENLMPLCGSGTTGCHGAVEGELDSVCRSVGLYIVQERPDTVEYLIKKFHTPERDGLAVATEFLRRRYRVVLPPREEPPYVGVSFLG
jgi:hypothetical protein